MTSNRTTNQGVYIAYAKRTAVGSFLGSLSTTPAPNLGAALINDLLSVTNLPRSAIDEVILGQVLSGGSGQNPARQSAVLSALGQDVSAFTINKVCGSGLKSVALAAQAIIAGDGELIIAGGQENMSLAMHGGYIRGGNKFGDLKLIDFMMYDGLTDAFSGALMGVTAENIAKKFAISREMQDEFAANSQAKAAAAQEAGLFADEILPIEVTSRKEKVTFSRDEGVRPDTTIEKLKLLKPAFDRSDSASVTAGNSSTINDGAACLLIASAAALKKYGLTPLARIVSYAQAGVDPSLMGTGPVPASQKALAKAGWSAQDLDLIEANEAFATQAIYVNQRMEWDLEKVNISGGAIAIGHPIGASGARVLTTLVHNMNRRKATKGLATLCIGGGMGVAMTLELV